MASANEEESFRNEYSGYTLSKEGTAIDRIGLSDVTPERFFQEYIRPRKPVVLLQSTSKEEEVEWLRGFRRWTNDYLRSRAGAASVQVAEMSIRAEDLLLEQI